MLVSIVLLPSVVMLNDRGLGKQPMLYRRRMASRIAILLLQPSWPRD
jgi:hypothetical protein